ncbi:TonB-dependent receptor [Sphingobium sp. EM0848]|uniref:TonB-dependent receptor n=1 Tax=Sphingobium sp. EM0848 TaxID=2743473 RepID=UPI002101AEEE|nr:TonB-dependent receptor [Sphingobium sp. EM0848]
MRLGLLLSSACMMAVSFSTAALAAEAADQDVSAQADGANGGLADIVVTAQKREGKLQDVPMAVSAIGAQELERRQVSSVADLAKLSPGVSVAQHAGYNRLFIRGIGLTSISNGQDPSVAFQVDGVVIGRPSAQLASFFDIERMEVLRGPQGTLYGRNATGGSVNLITRKPTRDFSGYLNLSYGNYDALTVDGAISGPLDKGGNVRARLAFQHIEHDGYGRNVTLGEQIDNQNSTAVRGTIEADLSDSVHVTLSGDYARERDHNYAFHAFGPYRSDVTMPGLANGGTILINSRDITSEVPTRNRREFWGFSGKIAIDLTDHLTIQSITGYRHSDRWSSNDPETTSFDAFSPVVTIERAKQFSQELQLNYSSDRLKGVFGLFYYDEPLHAELDLTWPYIGRLLGFANPAYHENGDIGIKSYAAFSEWTYEVLDGLRLTAGLRYSEDKRDSNGSLTVFNFMPPPNGANLVIPVNAKKKWDALTPKFGIDYRPSEDVMLYASVTRGFKSGVLLAGNPNPPVNPEYVWSYEAGFKTTLLDRRLQFNGSAFYYDYTDLQVNKIVGNSIITQNAAAARVKGLELETRAQPVPGVNLNAALTFLDTKFVSFITQNPARPENGNVDLKGNRLVNAPKVAINAGAEVDLPLNVPGRFSLRGDLTYSGRIYFTEFNEKALSQGAVALIDASLQYESADQHWSASLFVKNLTNKKVISNKFVAAALTGYAINGSFKPPRLYGVRVGYKF